MSRKRLGKDKKDIPVYHETYAMIYKVCTKTWLDSTLDRKYPMLKL